ncbi:MAG: hypothetical protein QXL17_07815 [Candidatus Thermoplasmatota archaeon]
MICDQCRSRFGRIGVDYWTAQSGICPACLHENSIPSETKTIKNKKQHN